MEINVHQAWTDKHVLPPDLVKSECRWACEVKMQLNIATHYSYFISVQLRFLLSFYCLISAPQTLEYNISRYFCTAIRIYPTQNDVSEFWYSSDLFFNLFLLQIPRLKSKVILFTFFLIFNSHTENFNTVIISLKSLFLISPCESSLVIQWLRLHASTEELQVWSLVGNENTACLAAKRKKNSPCDSTVVKDGL